MTHTRHTPSLAWILLILVALSAITEVIAGRLSGPIEPAKNLPIPYEPSPDTKAQP